MGETEGVATRIAVVDPEPIFGRGIAGILRERDEFVAIQTPYDAQKAAAAIAANECTIAVVGVIGDWNTTLDLVGRLNSLQQPCRTVVMVGGDGGGVASAVRAGIAGVILRGAEPDELVSTVRTVVAGRSAVAPELSGQLMDDFATLMRQVESRSGGMGLTSRELEVLELVAEGMGNRDVATKLHISENTVKNHLRHINEKLGASSRTEAVVIAARGGLLGIT